MRRIATIIAIFMLLSTAAPLLACMTGSAMNREESACCRAMQGNCGDMARMGCCQTKAQADEHPQLAVVPARTDFHFAVIFWLLPLQSNATPVPASLLQIPDEHSPPGLISAQTTVLRI